MDANDCCLIPDQCAIAKQGYDQQEICRKCQYNKNYSISVSDDVEVQYNYEPLIFPEKYFLAEDV